MEGNNPYTNLINIIVKTREKIKPVNPLQPINPWGRPKVVTKDVLVKLEQAYLFGCTDVQACAFAGICAKTLSNYQNENPDFLQEKEKWKQNPILKAKATVYGKLNEADTAKWYLERKAKDEFSTRQETLAKDEALLRKEKELEEEVEAEDDVVTKIKEQMVETQPPVQDKK